MKTLRAFIEESGTSQTELANRVGCSRSAISMLLSGQRRPSPELALRIQEATGGQVTVLELLYGQADRNAA